MVWNVLWMTAMAAASALAGFCMGRLSVQNGESYGEEAAEGQAAAGQGPASGTKSVETRVMRSGRSGWEAARSLWAQRTEDREVGGSVSALQDGACETQIGPADTKPAPRGTMEDDGGRLRAGAAGRLSDRMIRGRDGIVRPMRRGRRGRGQQEPEGMKWSVGSPVKGWLLSCRDDGHPSLVIQPEEDRLYAPAGGKIVKLFPMGNAFLLRTEFGTELYLQVGNVKDDLMGRYFRPRVVQNEIVTKGKLLLEFDIPNLVAEGISPAVTVRVENHSYGTNVRLAAREQTRTGEEILTVSERAGMDRV